MRSEGLVEGALPARVQSIQGGKWKKHGNDKKVTTFFDSSYTSKAPKYDFSPCKHCRRKGHSPFTCWRKPDQQCERCKKVGHHQNICKANTMSQENVEQKYAAQVVDLADEEEEEQLSVASCFPISHSSAKWLIDSGCTNHMTF